MRLLFYVVLKNHVSPLQTLSSLWSLLFDYYLQLLLNSKFLITRITSGFYFHHVSSSWHLLGDQQISVERINEWMRSVCSTFNRGVVVTQLQLS